MTPEIPSVIAGDEDAIREFLAVVQNCHDIFEPRDAEAWAIYATLLVDYKVWGEQIKREGATYLTSSGQRKPHPLAAARDRVLRIMLQLSRDLLISPARKGGGRRFHPSPRGPLSKNLSESLL